MTNSVASGSVIRCPRRWKFGACAFDESNWSLTVDGRRVGMETKPLLLLRELLLRAGHVVTKNELLDSIWGEVTVVEASLPTAVHKLRLALGDTRRDQRIIETVPGIGYRFAASITFDNGPAAIGPAELGAAPTSHAQTRPPRVGIDRPSSPLRPASLARYWSISRPSLVALVAALTIVSAASVTSPFKADSAAASRAPSPSPSTQDKLAALRALDLAAVQRMIAAGWNTGAGMDGDRNNAVNVALEVCEWDKAHDQRKLLLLVRRLLDAGASVTDQNRWGDTSYSIAKSPRYCGPDHPVTRMLREQCRSGGSAVMTACLATYERKTA